MNVMASWLDAMRYIPFEIEILQLELRAKTFTEFLLAKYSIKQCLLERRVCLFVCACVQNLLLNLIIQIKFAGRMSMSELVWG